MKQYITKEQLMEIDAAGVRKLEVWMAEHHYLKGYPLLSIGQMIEFLDENNYDWEFYWGSVKGGIELCNALWEAVKEVLSKL